MALHELTITGLPEGCRARIPDADDVAPLSALVTRHRRAARGSETAPADPATVEMQIVGAGSWTRRNVVVLDGASRHVAWLSVHDRAAGLTVLDVVVDPDLQPAVASTIAARLLDAGEQAAADIGMLRGLRATLLDATSYAGHARQAAWLSDAGYERVRTWWHMSRPVDAREAQSLPQPRPGVVVRRVEQHADGLPTARDLQTVHRLLEESFQDHFGSYRESFPEFVMRLREDPGHRWDHWWIATVERDGAAMPAGALVSTVSHSQDGGAEGSYVEYIGVHRDARGSGVAKALLHAVIADAAQRGRDRVGLEVDAESPTRAQELYGSMGWRTEYQSHTWHRHVALSPAG